MISFLISFFLIRYIRTILDTKQKHPYWDNILNIGTYATIGVMVLSFIFEGKYGINLLGHLILVAIVAAPYILEAFRPVRNITFAAGPLAAVALLNDILPLISTSWYKSLEN